MTESEKNQIIEIVKTTMQYQYNEWKDDRRDDFARAAIKLFGGYTSVDWGQCENGEVVLDERFKNYVKKVAFATAYIADEFMAALDKSKEG